MLLLKLNPLVTDQVQCICCELGLLVKSHQLSRPGSFWYRLSRGSLTIITHKMVKASPEVGSDGKVKTILEEHVEMAEKVLDGYTAVDCAVDLQTMMSRR